MRNQNNYNKKIKFSPFLFLGSLVIVLGISKMASLETERGSIVYSKGVILPIGPIFVDENLFLMSHLDAPSINITNFDNRYAAYDDPPRLFASDPVWSPNGCDIAFTLHVNRYDENVDKRIDTYDIYTISYDGSELHQLTFTGDSFDPSWTPDGKSIAFTSRQDGDLEIYIVDADCYKDSKGCNNDVIQLTDNEIYDADLSWSPDGQYVIFTSGRDIPGNVYLAESEDFLNGRVEQSIINLTYTRTDSPFPFGCFSVDDFAWSPKRLNQVVFMCSLGVQIKIGIIDISEVLEENANDEPLVPDFLFNDLSDYHAGVGGLSWSGDGEKLVFTLDYKRRDEDDYWSGIYIMDAQNLLDIQYPIETMWIIRGEESKESFTGVSWAPQICDADLD